MCISYRPGHNVHYIPVLRLVRDLEPVDATLTCEREQLTLTVGSQRTTMYSHDMHRVRSLLEDFGTRCLWYPTLRYACWPGAKVNRWASLSGAPITPCV